MITGILEIRDFLHNPDEVVALAKSIKYYSRAKHPEPVERNLLWRGMRSDCLYKFDHELFDSLFHSLFMSIVTKTMGSDKFRLQYEFVGNAVFHYMRKSDVYNDGWIHDDTGSILAGVLYLNKETRDDCGTVVFVDGKPTNIKNEYNKLVLYPAHLKHSSSSGFGKDVNDARLTLAFFVSSVGMRLSCI